MRSSAASSRGREKPNALDSAAPHGFEPGVPEAAVTDTQAVIWECGVLAWAGRVDLHRPLPQFFANLFSSPAYQPVDLTPEQIYRADESRPNRDPFDALICATARHLELALLTRDQDIRQSGLVRVIW